MKLRNALIVGSLLVLAGCGGTVKKTYVATSNLSDAQKNVELQHGVERVLIRRLAAIGIQSPKVVVVPDSQTASHVSLTVPSKAWGDIEHIMTDPFTFEIRIAEEGATPEEVTWKPSGVDGSMLDWIQSVQGTVTNDIGVELQFNAEGRKRLEEAFKGNKGKDAGIFVRDLLVSKLRINSEALSEHIVIRGIPSLKVAEIFADDVNVGLHIAFSPSK